MVNKKLINSLSYLGLVPFYVILIFYFFNKNFYLIDIFFYYSLVIITFLSGCEKTPEKNTKSGQLIVKVFSSLTCPHCANFHEKVIVSLKNDKSLKNFVKVEHHSFPLDLAALNAEKILYCSNTEEKRFDLLTILYKEQRKWASGSDINDINMNK